MTKTASHVENRLFSNEAKKNTVTIPKILLALTKYKIKYLYSSSFILGVELEMNDQLSQTDTKLKHFPKYQNTNRNT